MNVSHCIPTAFVQEGKEIYHATRAVTSEEILETARFILNRRFLETTAMINTEVAKDFLIAELSQLGYEVFCVTFLDVSLKVIAFEQLFRGTVDHATIYPREVVRRALELNAARVLLVHNHPSGNAVASEADKQVTKQLKEVLALFDIPVLDHFIVAGNAVTSFAEQGIL